MQERPDEILLQRTIESLEANIGDFDMEDVICQDGGVAVIDGKEVKLTTLEVGLAISEEDSKQGVDHMFPLYFEPTACALRDLIEDQGYNVCRPLGITNPNLIATKGLIQLCKRGEKTSLYMAHKFRDGQTTVTLKMLVGKLCQ